MVASDPRPHHRSTRAVAIEVTVAEGIVTQRRPEDENVAVIVVYSESQRSLTGLELHNGELVASFESADRVTGIADALRSESHEWVEPTEIDEQLLRRVHTTDYVDFLATAWSRWVELGDHGPAAMGFAWPGRGLASGAPTDLIGQLGYYSFAADCSIVDGTYEVARSAASTAMTAADRVIETQAATFGLCRPPGHHASADQFGGYCFFNNAALAAQRLLDRGASRVGVLDVDYHHGNGTQSIFYDRSDVIFASVHADPLQEFPWFAGHASETGSGDGEGANLNVPLARGATVAAWFDALDRSLAWISEAQVDGLVVSLGVDTFKDDPLGTFQLDTADFAESAARIDALGVAPAIVMEGGYAVDALGRNVAAFLSGF